MNKNYTVVFIMLFVASIAFGLALKKVFAYSMVFGVGFAVVFLLCAAFFRGKNGKNSNTQ